MYVVVVRDVVQLPTLVKSFLFESFHNFSCYVSLDLYLSSTRFPNVSCHTLDGQDMSAYKSNSVDVITCCYGYMFCPDPLKVIYTHTIIVYCGTGRALITTSKNETIYIYPLPHSPSPYANHLNINICNKYFVAKIEK
jgi:hypothetical protein